MTMPRTALGGASRIRRQGGGVRSYRALAVAAVGAALLIVRSACRLSFVAQPSAQRIRRDGFGSGVRLAADQVQELYIADASPKGKQVMAAYKKLVGVKDEDEIAEILGELDSDQREQLQQLIQLRGGAQKDITSPEPELGDTPERLYKKLQMLDGDDAVLEWRQKIDTGIMQEVQLLIEADQVKLADAEAALNFDDEADAQQCYEFFKAQFPKPAANEKYFTTPCRAADIKYRFRRMKEHLDIDSATALALAERDAAPFVVDPDYIRRTWKALVRECDDDRIDALENIVLKHPGALIANPTNLKGQINQAKMTAFMVDATSGINRWIRNTVTQNGQRTPIGAREEPAFGGGWPALKKKWEEEEKQRKREEKEASR